MGAYEYRGACAVRVSAYVETRSQYQVSPLLALHAYF